MERTETPITSSFLGLVKRGACPVCGAPISVNLGSSSMLLCPNCGDYLEVSEKKLRQMDPTLVIPDTTFLLTPGLAFAAATPWTDMQAPRFRALSFDMESTVTEMFLTKKEEGVRVLDAKWPSICCVCGKPATREETTAAQFIFAPPGIIRYDKEVMVVAKGIPHCAEHKKGAQFERAMFSTPEQETVVGLFFRSYAYQIQFRKVNPWKWR